MAAYPDAVHPDCEEVDRLDNQRYLTGTTASTSRYYPLGEFPLNPRREQDCLPTKSVEVHLKNYERRHWMGQ